MMRMVGERRALKQGRSAKDQFVSYNKKKKIFVAPYQRCYSRTLLCSHFLQLNKPRKTAAARAIESKTSICNSYLLKLKSLTFILVINSACRIWKG